MLGSFLVHGTLLHADQAELSNLFLPETDTEQYFPLMLLAHLLLAGAFASMYSRGAEAKSWLAQGIRFVLAIALLLVAPTYLIYCIVHPMPSVLVIKQIVVDGILPLILGAVAAWLNRGQTTDRWVRQRRRVARLLATQGQDSSNCRQRGLLEVVAA